ncbi:MAG: SocA family protein [Endomicrobium sp.]|nr:SocA family protein [Endomicrobium sp.]
MVSVRKILQALYYIQSKAPKDNTAKSDIMYLLKLIFFADRHHLRHFGFVASGDKYEAMKYGPVASAVKDILYGKMPNANSAELYLLREVEQLSEHDVLVLKQDTDELSESYKQSLNFSVKTFGKYKQFELSKITHDYPEWKKHEDKLSRGIKSVEMDFRDFFDNPKTLKCSKNYDIKEDPFKEADSKFLETLKEDFSESEISC